MGTGRVLGSCMAECCCVRIDRHGRPKSTRWNCCLGRRNVGRRPLPTPSRTLSSAKQFSLITLPRATIWGKGCLIPPVLRQSAAGETGPPARATVLGGGTPKRSGKGPQMGAAELKLSEFSDQSAVLPQTCYRVECQGRQAKEKAIEGLSMAGPTGRDRPLPLTPSDRSELCQTRPKTDGILRAPVSTCKD